MIGPHARAVALLVAGVAISSCATASPSPRDGSRAHGSSDDMVSGEGGLGISGQKTPAALQALVAAPYALPPQLDCTVMGREIHELDSILGPDVDAVAAARNNSGKAVGSAMRSFIPYRWVMRALTQAGQRDRDLRLAVLAGTARRSYLKGLRLGLACQPPQAPAR